MFARLLPAPRILSQTHNPGIHRQVQGFSGIGLHISGVSSILGISGELAAYMRIAVTFLKPWLLLRKGAELKQTNASVEE